MDPSLLKGKVENSSEVNNTTFPENQQTLLENLKLTISSFNITKNKTDLEDLLNSIVVKIQSLSENNKSSQKPALLDRYLKDDMEKGTSVNL